MCGGGLTVFGFQARGGGGGGEWVEAAGGGGWLQLLSFGNCDILGYSAHHSGQSIWENTF